MPDMLKALSFTPVLNKIKFACPQSQNSGDRGRRMRKSAIPSNNELKASLKYMNCFGGERSDMKNRRGDKHEYCKRSRKTTKKAQGRVPTE